MLALLYCVYLVPLSLFSVVIQEVSPHVIITSAKQEGCMTRFLQQLGEFWETKMILAWAGETEKCHREVCFDVVSDKYYLGQGNEMRLGMRDTEVCWCDKGEE